MSNDINNKDGNVWERLFKLWASICKLLLDGRRDLEKVANILQKIVDEVSNPFVRSVTTDTLNATDGKRTIVSAKSMFTGYFDGNFASWGTDVPGEAKPETPFEVFELVKKGKFAKIFGAFDIGLDKLCWSQDQIITFVENHADLLHPKGWSTFYLFKVGERFFVADVSRDDDGQLEAYVCQLSNDFVWNVENRYRFVFPQQTS